MTKLNRKGGSIGYKHPPAHTRFVKGKSGNPKGRPKGTRTADGLTRLINQLVTVTMEGKPQQVPLAEALVLSLAQKALAGNVAAMREFNKIVEKAAAERKSAEEFRPTNVLFSIQAPELRDCNAALLKLGVIEQYTDSWRVCTWVVEAALARNSQILSNGNDREIIAENMLSPEALRAILPDGA